jgi:hypothetical protein
MSVQAYQTDQLSVRPGKIQIGRDLILTGSYGSSEEEILAALLITMSRELDNQWWAFALGTVQQRITQEHIKAEAGQGSRLFVIRHTDIYNLGMERLCRRRMLSVQRLGRSAGNIDVVRPTEALLGPIARFIMR